MIWHGFRRNGTTIPATDDKIATTWRFADYHALCY